MIDIKLPKILQPTQVSKMVRVGRFGDGGYVIDKDLIEKTDILVGLGLGFDWSFEKDFFRRSGKKISVHGYDHTISSRRLFFYSIKNLLLFLLLWKKKYFSKSFLIADYLLFFGKKKVYHFNERVHWRSGDHRISMKDILERSKDFSGIFFKIDIEGSEYEVIEDILGNGNITGIVIEFHHLNLLEDKFLSIINLMKKNFTITHLHINNLSLIGKNGWPALLEFTFRNKKYTSSDTVMIHNIYPLDDIDVPNAPYLDDFRISFI